MTIDKDLLGAEIAKFNGLFIPDLDEAERDRIRKILDTTLSKNQKILIDLIVDSQHWEDTYSVLKGEEKRIRDFLTLQLPKLKRKAEGIKFNSLEKKLFNEAISDISFWLENPMGYIDDCFFSYTETDHGSIETWQTKEKKAEGLTESERLLYLAGLAESLIMAKSNSQEEIQKLLEQLREFKKHNARGAGRKPRREGKAEAVEQAFIKVKPSLGYLTKKSEILSALAREINTNLKKDLAQESIFKWPEYKQIRDKHKNGDWKKALDYLGIDL